MTMRRALVVSAVLSLGTFACKTTPPRERAPARGTPVGLFIVNGRFWGHPEAKALRIVGRRIAALGDLPAGVTSAIDAQGGHVLPGFHDSHMHLLGTGMSDEGAKLAEFTTLEAVLDAVKKFAAEHPDAPWVRGRGWQYSIVPRGTFPSRQDLDKAVPDRPALLTSFDGHTAWANTRALEIAHVDASTEDPDGGTIVRNADGSAQGTLLEDAEEVVGKVIPKASREQKLEALRRGAKELVDLGVTSIDDIEADEETLPLFATLLERRELPIRVRLALPIDGDLVAYATIRDRYAGDRLSFGFLKGFVDGVVESRTAYLVEPYEGSTSRGKPILGPKRLEELVGRAHAAGFPVALHAIGDAAVRISLDAFEAAEEEHPAIQLPHRIEHIEVISKVDIPRFAKLGVYASMQPLHAYPEPPTEVWSTNLGPARLPLTFAWHSLLDAKARLIFGSDSPVASPNPLTGLAVAVTRRDEKGEPAGGWNAHQAITMEEAIRAYTVEPALAAGTTELGALEQGMLADIAILSSDVDLARPETLWKGSVVHTIVGGVVEH